jgi:hypothetical protein
MTGAGPSRGSAQADDHGRVTSQAVHPVGYQPACGLEGLADQNLYQHRRLPPGPRRVEDAICTGKHPGRHRPFP